MRVTLNNDWTLTEKGGASMAVSVPATQYSALKRNGRIEDPYIGLNEKPAFYAAEKDWEFSRTFTLGESVFECARIDLCCARIDTLAEIYVNNAFVAELNNAHIPLRLDVKRYLKAGENRITITLRSPVAYIRKKNKAYPMPVNMNGLNGMQHIRKPACHFGWDWGPVLPVIGILSDVYLEAYDARVSRIEVKQEHSEGKVKLYLNAVCDGDFDGAVDFTVTAPDGTLVGRASAPAVKAAGDDASAHKCKSLPGAMVEVENPRLWWCADMLGEDEKPALYTVSAQLPGMGERPGKEIRIGLRTLVLDRGRDSIGQQFAFVLNGVPVFAKGGNWIPPDSIPDEFPFERVKDLLESFVRANMNMLRVWGGGFYETDEFYDACDELGLLVWQDFCFACAPYPFYDADFLSSVKKEVYANVNRLKHHACLALWCGNNEIEAMSAAWQLKRRLVNWTETFFYDILPGIVARADGVTPFVSGSPSGDGYMRHVASDRFGDTHLWHVWHGLRPLDYYKKRYTRFCSEFGLESLPDIKTVREFSQGGECSLQSPVFLSHQKCMSGNNKMLFYVSTRFRLPRDFADLVYLTQICQAVCVEEATEHWRRNKGMCNGSLYWQLNDCWPTISWAGMDYYGRPKALQYRAAHFFKPLTLSLTRKGAVAGFHLLNDTRSPFEGTVKYSLYSFDGAELASGSIGVSAAAGECKKCGEENFAAFGKDVVLRAELLSSDGGAVAVKTMLFDAEKNLKLPKTTINVSFGDYSEGGTVLELTCESYARFVRLECEGGDAEFSDNYFDLLPGETKRIIVRCDGAALPTVAAKSLCDVAPRGSKFGDSLTRLKIRLIPINIINAIGYRFM